MGRRDIRSFGAQNRQLQRFVDASWRLRMARRRAFSLQNGFTSFLRFLYPLAGATILIVSGPSVYTGAISVGTVLTLRLLTEQATAPLSLLATVYVKALDVRVSWQRLREPFHVPILPGAPRGLP